MSALGRRATASAYQLLGQQQFRAIGLAAVHKAVSRDVTAGDIQSWNEAKPFDQIPGSRSLPLIGTSWIMFPFVGAGIDVTRIMELHEYMHKRYGYIWRDNFPGKPAIVSIVRPEDVETLFRAEGKYPERPGFDTIKVYRQKRVEQFTANNGVMAGQGEPWWTVRSIAQQPMLKTKNVNNYMPILGEIAEDFIDRIRLIRLNNGEMKPDFINEMYRWALESVAVVGFNTRLGCLSPDLADESEPMRMIRSANFTFATVNELEFGIPVWKYVTTSSMRRLIEAQDFFTDTALKYINQTLETMKRKPADSEDDPSILEELFLRGMTQRDALVMVVDLLMTGIDTTSHTTSFLFYFLAKNQDKQEKLRSEILSVIGPKGSPITPGGLNRLHYLKACVKESLRLMPATVGNARITEKNLVLSGYQVPKGTLVATTHQMTSRLDEYFPNAKAYIPERWIKGDPQESHHHRHAALPFGFGLRMCIGRRLAELEMWQLTIKMLQNFKIEYHYQDIGCINRLVNIPDQPLRFKFIDLK